MFYVNTKNYYPKNEVPSVVSSKVIEYYVRKYEKCEDDKQKHDELVNTRKENDHDSL